jgi:crotonobetainyl-CoA:carnitine CoA-transferase CaiB-like acyl-CoA transferase
VLSPYRVIDLACDRGILCGQILADLGADVIQVEPRDGSALRRSGPFLRDEPDPERSLAFSAYARGKRSVALDLDDASDREVLKQLIAGADFLIEAEDPGRLEALGLGDAALEALQPGLVHVSITPFGRTGPKAGWAATDLTLIAAAGLAHLNGEGRLSADPLLRAAGVRARGRRRGGRRADRALRATAAGRGQHVDVAAQQLAHARHAVPLARRAAREAPARRLAGGVVRRGPLHPAALPAARRLGRARARRSCPRPATS